MKHIMAICITILTLITTLLAEVVPNDQDYFTTNAYKSEIIYTKKHQNFLRQTMQKEYEINTLYQQYFSWNFDETLYVGLISDYNQIANGFSTPYPNNRQINYVGGSQKVDYFTSTSWLNTLLYHETAHNYQSNVKGSGVSQFLHTTLGNGSFFIPWFTVPNITESSFLLEGNAVLNESWHGNGGRLYSGRFLAQTILQANAGYITPSRMYNETLNFPYGEKNYIIGGFFQLYLAQKYSLQSTNNYFKEHSKYWAWPFFVNAPMNAIVGNDFEKELQLFTTEISSKYKDFKMLDGDILTTSQFFYELSRNNNSIFFLANTTGREVNSLVVYDKKTEKLTLTKSTLSGDKTIYHDNKFLIQSSSHISPTKIYQGLFDENKFIYKDTKSKVVQGYLENGSIVYFDVTTSFDQPQLYIADKFYSQVNSSVIIDKNDIYYFKQEAETRTLYKNRDKILSYRGYYGIVSDISEDGTVYFIANSELGSTLYGIKDEVLFRASRADNIVSAKLIDKNSVLLAALSSDEYYYVNSPIVNEKSNIYSSKLFFENKNYYAKKIKPSTKNFDMNISKPYGALYDMHYSGTHATFSQSSEAGFLYNVSAIFSDPLTQNSAVVYFLKDITQTTRAGVSYSNSEYLLSYTLDTYAVSENNRTINNRYYGISALATLPLYKAGYLNSELTASYFQDYESATREPLSLQANISKEESYGISMFSSFRNYLNIYATYDRDDIVYGANYNFLYDVGMENYFELYLQYSNSDTELTTVQSLFENRGVKVSALLLDNFDPTTIVMPGIRSSAYVESIAKSTLSYKKVLNFSQYFFTFPLSVRREAIVVDYNYYYLDRFFTSEKLNINEVSSRVVFDTLLMNKALIGVSFEYIYNDLYPDPHSFNFSLDLPL